MNGRMITSFRCKYGCLLFGHSFTAVLSLYLYKRTLQIENIYASLSDRMINFVCVCLCLVSINNAHPLEGFRQDLIADLKDYFGQEVNRIELKYADETNALRQELTTCKEEINKLKLKLSQERHERVIKIARLKQRQSVVIKELHDLKLQLHGEYIEEGKRNDHLRNELYLRKHKDEGLLKLKTNLKVAENNTIPHGAEKIQHTSKNCTYENRSGKQVMSADPGADSNSRSKVRRFVGKYSRCYFSYQFFLSVVPFVRRTV